MNKFIIYTDGSSRGNPGPGGWGAIVFSENSVLEIGGREEMTTNNRMEIRAAIEALQLVSLAQSKLSDFDQRNTIVEIHADSEYLIKGITIWIKNWQKNNWRTKDKKAVLNKDLWEKLLTETEKRKVEWKKVLGHSGHELNERCDEIATSFADGKKIDLYDGPKQGYFYVS